MGRSKRFLLSEQPTNRGFVTIRRSLGVKDKLGGFVNFKETNKCLENERDNNTDESNKTRVKLF